MSTEMKIRFWGVRGSYPVPGGAVGEKHRYGGNTACVEVRLGGQTLLLDAGTGIIPAGRSLLERAHRSGSPVNVTLLFSHLHHDHTQGFPFFSPAFIPSSRLRLYGPGIPTGSFQPALAQVMSPPLFPVTIDEMGASKEFHELCGGEVVVIGDPAHRAGAVTIRALRSYAHPGGTLIYRIECCGRSLVYATDVESYIGGDQRLARFAQGADLLIHDAQYSESHYLGKCAGLPIVQGFGHSTPEMACEAARAAGVKGLVLFHHDPNYDDDTITALEASARRLFPDVRSAYEGLEISLGTTTQETSTGDPAVPVPARRKSPPAGLPSRPQAQAAALRRRVILRTTQETTSSGRKLS